MKLEVVKYGENYYCIEDIINNGHDDAIAKRLDMDYNHYQGILEYHGAQKEADDSHDDCHFRYREDALDALKDLEPYIIMANLTGE